MNAQGVLCALVLLTQVAYGFVPGDENGSVAPDKKSLQLTEAVKDAEAAANTTLICGYNSSFYLSSLGDQDNKESNCTINEIISFSPYRDSCFCFCEVINPSNVDQNNETYCFMDINAEASRLSACVEQRMDERKFYQDERKQNNLSAKEMLNIHENVFRSEGEQNYKPENVFHIDDRFKKPSKKELIANTCTDLEGYETTNIAKRIGDNVEKRNISGVDQDTQCYLCYKCRHKSLNQTSIKSHSLHSLPNYLINVSQHFSTPPQSPLQPSYKNSSVSKYEDDLSRLCIKHIGAELGDNSQAHFTSHQGREKYDTLNELKIQHAYPKIPANMHVRSSISLGLIDGVYPYIPLYALLSNYKCQRTEIPSEGQYGFFKRSDRDHREKRGTKQIFPSLKEMKDKYKIWRTDLMHRALKDYRFYRKVPMEKYFDENWRKNPKFKYDIPLEPMKVLYKQSKMGDNQKSLYSGFSPSFYVWSSKMANLHEYMHENQESYEIPEKVFVDYETSGIKRFDPDDRLARRDTHFEVEPSALTKRLKEFDTVDKMIDRGMLKMGCADRQCHYEHTRALSRERPLRNRMDAGPYFRDTISADFIAKSSADFKECRKRLTNQDDTFSNARANQHFFKHGSQNKYTKEKENQQNNNAVVRDGSPQSVNNPCIKLRITDKTYDTVSDPETETWENDELIKLLKSDSYFDTFDKETMTTKEDETEAASLDHIRNMEPKRNWLSKFNCLNTVLLGIFCMLHGWIFSEDYPKYFNIMNPYPIFRNEGAIFKNVECLV